MESNKFPEMEYSCRILGKHLTATEAAGLLGLSHKQLKRLTEEGEIRTVQLGDLNIYYEKEELVKWALLAIEDHLDIIPQVSSRINEPKNK